MELIVPTLVFPPGRPFTLHETVLSAAFWTSAENACVLPNKIEAATGVTVMVIDGGGGGGGSVAELTPPPPQPGNAAPAARTKTKARTLVHALCASPPTLSSFGKCLTPERIAGEGPAKRGAGAGLGLE